jgi:uncharacterized protein
MLKIAPIPWVIALNISSITEVWFFRTILQLYQLLKLIMYNNIMLKLSVREVKNLKEKVQGLIGRDEPVAIMLKTRFGIHTFGVKFPIDVLILNNSNKVMSVKENLKPNRIFFWNPKYKKVLELPGGIIKKKIIKMNDVIDLKLT